MMATAGERHTSNQDEALLDIYRKPASGRAPTKESAQTLLENLFFKDKGLTLARVGRYKVNRSWA